jgi:hypothetical protein
MEDKAIRKIASYGDVYVKEYLYDEYGGEKGRIDIQNEPFKALEFFFGHSFYQGRSDKISEKVDIAARETIEDFIKKAGGDYEAILKKENHKEIRVRLESVIGAGKVGKKNDIEMVISTLNFISKRKSKNIVSYSIDKIKDGKVKELYDEIDEIFQIGQKCDAVFLRDVVSLYNLQNKVSEDDFIYLQPIDTWVTQVSHKLGIIELAPKEKDYLSAAIENKYEGFRNDIVKSCRKLGVSPISYNQGAWYVAANSYDLIMDIFMDKQILNHESSSIISKKIKNRKN